MASIVDQELAVRAAILTVAPTGTLLIKAASPGRLYEAITIGELSDLLSQYVGNLDGGYEPSNYGGITPIDAGGP